MTSSVTWRETACSEGAVKVINNSTVIFKPIMSKGKAVGAIGVIGPLRMDYARVLTMLDNLGENVSNLLSEPNKGEHQGKKKTRTAKCWKTPLPRSPLPRRHRARRKSKDAPRHRC